MNSQIKNRTLILIHNYTSDYHSRTEVFLFQLMIEIKKILYYELKR